MKRKSKCKALTPDSSKAVNVDLTAYAKSTDVTKEIASAVSGVTQIDYSVVESLPSTGKKGNYLFSC